MDKKNLAIIILSVMLVIAIAIIVTLLPKDVDEMYTISFNTNGGQEVISQEIKDGETATKPNDPTKEGFNFLGWYLNGIEYEFSKPIKGNITLEAKWEEIIVEEETEIEEDKEDEEDEEVTKYTVTFNSNGGSSVAKQTIEKNKTAKQPKNPTRSGYTFLGWYLGTTKYNFSKKVTKNITLIAKWEKVEEEKTNTEQEVKDVVRVDIVKDEGSSTGQYIIYVLRNGKRVAGTVDITNSKGITKTVSIPSTGLSRPEGSFTTVTNPKVK